MYDPEFAGKVINACAVLHNMRLQYNVPFPESPECPELPGNTGISESVPNSLIKPGETRAVARGIQRRLMRELFPHLRSA